MSMITFVSVTTIMFVGISLIALVMDKLAR